MTTPFVDEMYDLLKNTLTEYEVIICRWPEYIFVLENVCFKPLNFFFVILASEMYLICHVVFVL
jgi:hypothetical protein